MPVSQHGLRVGIDVPEERASHCDRPVVAQTRGHVRKIQRKSFFDFYLLALLRSAQAFEFLFVRVEGIEILLRESVRLLPRARLGADASLAPILVNSQRLRAAATPPLRSL